MYLISCVLYALFAYSVVDSASIQNEFDSALLGPEQCLDSSYWCTNFTTSVECNAVNHCIQVVWSNQLPVYGSCGSCESEIQTIRDNIDSNLTKTAMEDLLDSICDLNFVTAVFRKTCTMLINKYIDYNFNELLDLLTSEVDPSTICHLLGFCSSVEKPESSYEDDAVVRFSNIELHFPTKMLNLPNMIDIMGSNRCTWGPSQWCGNLTSARECHSHRYCLENQWTKTEFPEDNDSICQICKDMVKQARDQLQSNETQEELKEVFEGSCKLIPIKEVAKECISVVDQFIPELTDMLVSAMNPTAVCSVAGLCNNARIDKLLAANVGANSELKLDTCVNCTVAFTSLEKYLHQNSKVTILNRLLQVCGEFSSFSDSCSTLISERFDDLYEYLLNLQPWSACHMSGMCAYKYHFHPQPEDAVIIEKAERMLKKSDDLPCDLCKQLVTHFKDVLIANTTEDEFLQILKGMCKQAGSFEKECTQLVEENFQVIYDFLTKELDPPKICAEINLCPRKNFVSDINLNLIQDKYTPVINTPVKVLSQPSTNLSSATECRFCKFIIQMVQHEIENPKIEKDIEKALKKTCKLVSKSEVAKCDKFVEMYSQILIDLLSKETDPGIVCATIDLCPDVRLINNFAFCPLCQNALHFVQTEMEDPKTEQQIEDSLKKVCNVVPEAELAQCKEFISQYSALVISVLAEEVDPSLVCPALKLCPALTASQNHCESCTQTMNSLIQPLKKPTPLSIYQGLKTMTKSLPKSLTVTGIQMRIEHSSEIVDMLMAEFSSEEACTYMKYCNQYPQYEVLTGGVVESNEIEAISSDIIFNTVSAPSCEVCELFVKLYESKLTSKTSEEELEQLFIKYCDHLTDKELQQNCTNMVDKYVPKLFDLLKKDVTPKELCQLAKICPAFSSTGSLEKCRSCEVAIGSLQGILSDPYVMNAEFLKLDKICSYVNIKSRKICDMAVLTLGRQIEGIALGIPSWYYCSKINMCPYKSELIQFEQCSKGESFWCLGNETAVVCDKLKYCQDMVWKSDQPSRN